MSKTILIIDDSKVIREIVRTTLKKISYQSLEAEDGRAGLDMLEQHRVDAVITDLHMPNINGMEVIRKIRCDERFRHLPILVLTTEIDASRRAIGFAAGANDWLIKPFKAEGLIHAVKKLCESPEAA